MLNVERRISLSALKYPKVALQTPGVNVFTRITIFGYCGVDQMVVLLQTENGNIAYYIDRPFFCFRINSIEVAQVQRPLCFSIVYSRHTPKVSLRWWQVAFISSMIRQNLSPFGKRSMLFGK